MEEQLTEIIIETAGPQAASVAPAISVLVEGAIVTAVSEGNAHAAGIAEEAAEILISQTQ